MSETVEGSHGIAGSENVKLVRYVREKNVVRMRISNIEDI